MGNTNACLPKEKQLQMIIDQEIDANPWQWRDKMIQQTEDHSCGLSYDDKIILRRNMTINHMKSLGFRPITAHEYKNLLDNKDSNIKLWIKINEVDTDHKEEPMNNMLSLTSTHDQCNQKEVDENVILSNAIIGSRCIEQYENDGTMLITSADEIEVDLQIVPFSTVSSYCGNIVD